MDRFTPLLPTPLTLPLLLLPLLLLLLLLLPNFHGVSKQAAGRLQSRGRTAERLCVSYVSLPRRGREGRE